MSLFIIQKILFLFFKLLDILFLGKRTLIKVRRKGLMNVPPHYPLNCCSSVAKSCLTLRPHGRQHIRLPVFHLITHSLLRLTSIESVTSSNLLILCCCFHSCPQAFPAPGSFPGSLFFILGGKCIGVASASVLPMNIQDWFPLGWTSWISLLSKGLSSLLQHHSSKASILRHSAFFIVQLSHPYMTTGKTIALTIWTFVGKVISLLFNILSRFVIAFLSRSKHFWFQACSHCLQQFWSPGK